MTIIATYLAGILIIIGSFFALTAALGLIRLPDVYSRMHA
ncbi:MAG: monovalent cation/H(+) antiporter subunit G, partial [Nitratireductor sp.]|nr:monovalent cation/H(+) antiporter subunit G [Nitratireductor sp.]